VAVLPAERAGELVARFGRHAEGATEILQCARQEVGDAIAHHGFGAGTEAAFDPGEHLVATGGGDVDVDVGW
jgi:hypothetical protein